MSVAKEIKKLHNLSDAVVKSRLMRVRIELKLRYNEPITIEQYLKIFKK